MVYTGAINRYHAKDFDSVALGGMGAQRHSEDNHRRHQMNNRSKAMETTTATRGKVKDESIYPIHSIEDGYHWLATMLIVKASDDYKALAHRGVIDHGHFTQWPLRVPSKTGKSSCGNRYERIRTLKGPADANALLQFFEPAGECDEYLYLLDSEIEPDAVRSVMHATPSDGKDTYKTKRGGANGGKVVSGHRSRGRSALVGDCEGGG